MTNKLRVAAELALEALEEIALAGMSPAPEMIDSKEAFHARQAWRFIGIAARQLPALRTALAEQPAKQSTNPVGAVFQRPMAWVGLSKADKLEILRANGEAAVMYLAEAKLREKNAEQPAEQCNHCNGSGRMVRDQDIGTDQECFVCEGRGAVEPEQPAEQEPVAFCDPSEPNARYAFSWPGTDRQHSHTAPLYTAPQPAKQPLTGWQPIETAPDGAEVFIGAFIDGVFKFGRSVRFYEQGNEFAGETWSGWVWSIDDCDDSVAEMPTHWMPLPSTPIEAAHGIRKPNDIKT